MLLSVPATILATSWLDTRVLGEATLISVAAVTIGFLVLRSWPKRLAPQVFAVLAAFFFTGGMAYAGSAGAGLALIVLIVVAIIIGGAALVL